MHTRGLGRGEGGVSLKKLDHKSLIKDENRGNPLDFLITPSTTLKPVCIHLIFSSKMSFSSYYNFFAKRSQIKKQCLLLVLLTQSRVFHLIDEE
jgi:hypothetical protein